MRAINRAAIFRLRVESRNLKIAALLTSAALIAFGFCRAILCRLPPPPILTLFFSCIGDVILFALRLFAIRTQAYPLYRHPLGGN